MTVAELLRDKFAEECEDGLLIIYTEGERSYLSDFRDDFAAETYGERDILAYHFHPANSYGDPAELEIELA